MYDFFLSTLSSQVSYRFYTNTAQQQNILHCTRTRRNHTQTMLHKSFKTAQLLNSCDVSDLATLD